MFCHNCGKELKDGERFCTRCGKTQNQKSNNIKENTIPCPFCGSTDITKKDKPSTFKGIYYIGAGILCLLIRIASKGSTIWMTLLGMAFLIFGVILYLKAKHDISLLDESKWTLKCNTCKKDFSIDPPDGSQIITNIKSEHE